MTEINHQDIFDTVATIIAKTLSIDKNIINASATLQDLGADSLDIFEIIMKLEEQFNIEINDEEAEKLKNVQDVVDYINKLRSK